MSCGSFRVEFGEVDLGVVEIVAGVFEDELAVDVGEFAAEFGGDAGPEGAGRDDGVLGDDGAGGDDGASPMRQSLRTVAPMPMSTASSTMQPWTVALWPMVTQSPTSTG